MLHVTDTFDYRHPRAPQGNSLIKLLNLTLFFASIAITAHVIHVVQQANHLDTLVSELYTKSMREWELQCRNQMLSREVAILNRRELYFEESLREMLQECQSRDDFLVREGPWIVVGKLKTMDDYGQRIGVYLPAGKHVLKYATARFPHSDNASDMFSQRFFGDAPGNLKTVHSFPLEETPEIFTLLFNWNTESEVASVRMKVMGKQNAIVFEQIQTLPAERVKVEFPGSEQLRTIAYPSELLIDDNTERRLAEGHRPYTRILDLRGVRSQATASGFRVWIESDAPPCIAALKFARQFDKITDLLWSRGFSRPDEVSKLFLPYDGSGRYVFQPKIFESLSTPHYGIMSTQDHAF